MWRLLSVHGSALASKLPLHLQNIPSIASSGDSDNDDDDDAEIVFSNNNDASNAVDVGYLTDLVMITLQILLSVVP